MTFICTKFTAALFTFLSIITSISALLHSQVICAFYHVFIVCCTACLSSQSASLYNNTTDIKSDTDGVLTLTMSPFFQPAQTVACGWANKRNGVVQRENICELFLRTPRFCASRRAVSHAHDWPSLRVLASRGSCRRGRVIM